MVKHVLVGAARTLLVYENDANDVCVHVRVCVCVCIAAGLRLTASSLFTVISAIFIGFVIQQL